MIKLLFSDYDRKRGVSYVKILTDKGIFEDYAYLSEEDKDIESSFAGCQMAEYRCIIQYYKKTLSQINLKLQTYYDLQKDFYFNSQANEVLNKKIKQKEIEKELLKRNIKSLKDSIKNIPDNIKKSKEKIQKIHNKNMKHIQK